MSNLIFPNRPAAPPSAAPGVQIAFGLAGPNVVIQVTSTIALSPADARNFAAGITAAAEQGERVNLGLVQTAEPGLSIAANGRGGHR